MRIEKTNSSNVTSQVFEYIDRVTSKADNEKFRKAQYEEGYFSFKEDGFGPVCETFEELKTALKRAIDENLKNPEVYLNREKEFFTIWDTDNCKRNYEEIKKLQESL